MTCTNLNLDQKGGCIEAIIGKARISGFVELGELMECLSSSGVTNTNQIEDIVKMINDMGFKIAQK